MCAVTFFTYSCMVVGSMLNVFHRLGLVLGSSAVRLDTFFLIFVFVNNNALFGANFFII